MYNVNKLEYLVNFVKATITWENSFADMVIVKESILVINEYI